MENTKKTVNTLFHNDILRDFQETFNEHCQKLADFFQGETNKDFTYIDNYIKLASLDMICETMFGVAVKAFENEDSQYAKAGLKIGEIFMTRVYNFFLWPDFIFKRTKTGKDFFYHLKVIQDFTRSVSDPREKSRYLKNGEEGDKRKRKGLMDMLLERHMQFQDMTEEGIREEVDTFIMEGHDTIAISIIWTLFLLGHHPEVQAKLHEELDRTLGKDVGMPVSVDDLNNLTYLECIIKESNRIYTVVPIFGRQVNEDIDIYESVFPDPERFDPDRFLQENAANIPEYGFIPFSAGPRNCIGKVYAMMEMKTILCHIFRRFTVTSLDGKDKVLPVMHVTLNNSIPVRIRFRPRGSGSTKEI
ncbi:Cytochrome P450 4V2 like protein [Argiope bruennichi]|uniref:Cytochrome P450 4V2 like protein n=1 Tax=Argiope bruennichi TaxID=94029 RepID=A0A8T0G3Y9_ARGBR|nr:Cytochrome P450 4V2 like protein [Argiope bruennichi]